MSTLNMWSAVQNFVAAPVTAPNYADLAVGYAYGVAIINTTGDDITSGTISFLGADALPDNPCAPGAFTPLDPVAGCAPIVSGVPETGPVTVTITPQMPIPAHSVCQFAVPCPKQFLQVSGVPAGAIAIAIITNLRRTNWDHLGPYGQVPPPLQLHAPFGGQMAPAPQSGSVQRSPSPQQPRRQPQPAE